MKRIVIEFTTFLMLGVNLAAEDHMANKFPIEESANQKNSIVRETPKMNAMEEKSELVELAKKHFDDLSEAEIKFFTAIEKEEIADYTSSNEEENNPENADQWGNDRVLHAKIIKWLCTDPKAAKLVTLQGIQITGARIEGELNLRFAVMSFPLVFLKCAFEKEINLQYAQIQALHLGGTHTGHINADGLEVKSFAYLRNGFKAEGEVRFLNATIGENLECDNSEFINPEGRALFADGLNVKGSIFLRKGFKAEGEVRLPGANIGGMLDCIEGEFINPGGCALFADGINVKSAVILRDGFKAKGVVRLLGATIGGDFDCSSDPDKETKGGEFINPDGRALSADGLDVKGSVFLRYGFKAEGKISLENAIINNSFVYKDVESPEKAILSLRSAKIGVLWDEKKSWPKKGNLHLHGLVYDNLDEEAPKDAKSRIEWLRLNVGKEFSPQPYEQLAEVLKRSGHEEDAKEVLIAKNEDRAKLDTELSMAQKFWYKVLGPMIGYGYRPLKAFLPILVFIVLGWVFFWSGYQRGVMSPMAEDHPIFQPLVYSIDMFMPVVNLYQGNYWLPDAKKVWFECKSVKMSGWWLLGYLRIHIMAGWVLTTLLLGGLTGLIRT